MKQSNEIIPVNWGKTEWLVLILSLSSALLFLPGAQQMRFAIRAAPYATSLLGLLAAVIAGSRTRRPLGREAGATVPKLPLFVSWLVLGLGILAASQLHPDSVQPSGIAQCVFQLAIIAPAFWVWREIRNLHQLRRLIWLVFLCNGVNALTGLLQVLDPVRFLPPEFSRLGIEMNPAWVDSLSYVTSSGRRVVRPPGLSDMPGGAAMAGMFTGFLGMVLAIQPLARIHVRIICMTAAAGGMCVLYLTQVRSLFLVMVGAIATMSCVLWARRQLSTGLGLLLLAMALLAGSFLWASRLGGESVTERFLTLADEDLGTTYQRHRGIFLSYTLTELLAEHPLGAGTGRWGMMSVYFRPSDPMAPLPIHVEIQLTGWLVDGGVPLWIAFGGAILAALWQTVKLAIGRSRWQPFHTLRKTIPTNPDASPESSNETAYWVGVVLCLLLAIVAQSFAGPTFNTHIGIQFWLLAAAVHGVGYNASRRKHNQAWSNSSDPSPNHTSRS